MKRTRGIIRNAMVAVLSFLTAACLCAGVWLIAPFTGFAEEGSSPYAKTADLTAAEKRVADILEECGMEDAEPVILRSAGGKTIGEVWSEAVTNYNVTANKPPYLYMKLEEDWVATVYEGQTEATFGIPTSTGFNSPTAQVPSGTIVIANLRVILDLNGNVIDRGFTGTGSVGSIFYLANSASELILVDSDPAKTHLIDENAPDTIQNSKYTYEIYSEDGDDEEKDTVTVAITGGVLTGGSATGVSEYQSAVYGGAIRLYSSTLKLYGGTIFGNQCSKHGGGIYANVSSRIEIDGGSVIGNAAISGPSSLSDPNAHYSSVGGGIYSDGILEIRNAVIADNTSNDGGGIFAGTPASSSDVVYYTNISGGVLTNNRAANQGGAIYVSGKLTVSGGNIIGNRTLTSAEGGSGYSSGGAIYSKGECEIAGGYIAYNRSVSGSAVFSTADLVLSGGTITANEGTSGSAGSAIYFVGGGAKLYFAGPVKVHDNLCNGFTKYVSYDIGGSISETVVTSALEGEPIEVDDPENAGEKIKIRDGARIYIPSQFTPIKDYAYYNPPVDGDGAGGYQDPNDYFFFSYTEGEVDAIWDDSEQGVVCSYKLAYGFFHYDASSKNYTIINDNPDDENNDLRYSGGVTYMYGETNADGTLKMLSENGDHGVQVKFKYPGYYSSAIWFYKYEYNEEGLRVEDRDDENYNYLGRVTEIVGAGIYYSGSTYYNNNLVSLTITVTPKAIGRDDEAVAGVQISYDDSDKEFTGKEWQPNVSGINLLNWLDKDSHALTAGTDYTVSWENNIHVGDYPAYVVVTGKGNYAGTVKLPFKIYQPVDGEDSTTSTKYTLFKWQYYDMASDEWKDFASTGVATPFTFGNLSYDNLVRAVLTADFGSWNTANKTYGLTEYTAYVYADGVAVEYQLKGEDQTQTDPGLKLVISGIFDGNAVSGLFNATTYTLTIVKANEATGGNFDMPDDKQLQLKIAPFEVDIKESHFAETDTSLFAVKVEKDGSTTYIPFDSNVIYIDGGNVIEGDKTFYYVLYNGQVFEIVINPEFEVDFDADVNGFVANFLELVKNINYTHTLSELKGKEGETSVITTAFEFTLNSNFIIKGSSEGTATGRFSKEWAIVTKNNQITANGEDGAEIVYGALQALAAPSVEYGGVTVITLSKDTVELEKVVLVNGALYKYSANAQNNLGERINGTFTQYFDTLLNDNGTGNYTVNIEAPAYISEKDEELGAIYNSAAKNYSFTVTSRAINNVEDRQLVVTVNSQGLVYSGEQLTVEIIITLNGEVLKEGTDYTVEYANNVNAGTNTAKVTVTGNGNFSEAFERTFSIAKATDNVWETSLNIAPWVFGTFNREISEIFGEPRYGAGTVRFMIVPSEELNDKLTTEQKSALESVEVTDGMVSEELAEIFKTLPVGSYTLKAEVEGTSNYEGLRGEYVFRVIPSTYNLPSLNVIEDGNLKNNEYTGGRLTMSILDYDNLAMDVTLDERLEMDAAGNIYATSAGEYKVTLKLKDPETCSWLGEGADEDGKITLTWVIQRKVVKAPEPNSGSYIMNGRDQTYIPLYFDPSIMRIEGNVQSEAGNHNVRIYLIDTDNYVWDDGTDGARTIVWEIDSSYTLFIIIICILAGLILIAGLAALIQFLKHNARMADLAAADAEAKNAQETALSQPDEGAADAKDENAQGGKE